MKYLFLFVVAAVILFPKETQNQTINNYQVEWDTYKNMILISNKEGLQKIPTRI